jgi:hypothetical protein
VLTGTNRSIERLIAADLFACSDKPYSAVKTLEVGYQVPFWHLTSVI